MHVPRCSAGDDGVDPAQLAEADLEDLARLRPRNVINATGVLLHTNLGRAPLALVAAEAALEHATGYGNLEFDLASGDRGGRGAYVETLLRRLTGAPAAMVVNNNAAALFLTLMALAGGRQVPVSRGELIEIGGSYRLPELMSASGAQLLEVGTTNRTRVSDYTAAEDAALLLKVHPSNYRIEGFTEEATLPELVALGRSVRDPGGVRRRKRSARRHNPMAAPWAAALVGRGTGRETGARDRGGSGALLGRQVVGRPPSGNRGRTRGPGGTPPASSGSESAPLRWSVLAALGATLELYADGRAATAIPFWRLATVDRDEISRRAEDVVKAAGVEATIAHGVSAAGAGSAPNGGIPTKLIVVERPGADVVWLRLLASGGDPVVARRHAGSTLIDLRTVEPERDAEVAQALAVACRG